MIKPLSLIVSLLIVMSYADDPPPRIDFTRCEGDTNCYVTQSCLVDPGLGTGVLGDPKKLVYFDGAETALINSECDTAIQVKQFSKTQMLVIVELRGINTEEIRISQQPSDAEMFACAKTLQTPSGEAKFQLEYDEQPIFNPTGITRCSWILDTGSDAIPIDTVPLPKTDTLQLKLTSNILDYDTTNFWDFISTTSCGSVTFLKSSEEYTMKRSYDLFKPEIKCTTGKLIAKLKSGKYESVEKVECKSAKLKWHLDATVFNRGDPLEIGCTDKKYCASCAEMKKHACVASNECVAAEPEANRPDGCMVMKCDDDKWTLDGRKNFNNKDVTCKKKPDGTSDWVRQDKTDGEVPPTGLGCLKKALCRGPNEDTDIKLNCPEGVEQCSPPVLKNDNQVMNCTEGLIFYVDGSPPVENPQCNDGLWSVKGEIYCAPPKVAETGEKVGTGGMSAGTIVAIIGVIVVVAVVGGLVYFFVVKPRMAKKTSKAAGPSKKGAKSSKKSTESKSGAKKPSDSDPPEKASGKEGGATPDGVTPGGNTPGPTPVTDLEKIKTEPSGPKTPEVAAAPGGAPGAPPPPPAAPAPGQSAV